MVLRKLLFSAALAFGVASSASATTNLTVDSGWTVFQFGGAGSAFSDTFSFVLAAPTYLQLTDGWLSGDQFSVSITGFMSSFLTSTPGSQGDQIGADYTAAFADSRWSHLEVLLGPGSYTVSGEVVQSPFDGGDAALQLVTANVPGPIAGAGLPMLLASAGFLALRRRARS